MFVPCALRAMHFVVFSSGADVSTSLPLGRIDSKWLSLLAASSS